tara:strand:- start:402 stop:1457 length:1056 start_codon:yes stop_codon:yes gene_type:complete
MTLNNKKYNHKIIRLLSINELEEFQNFIKHNWSRNHIFVLNKLIFNWQHKGKSDYHFMIAKLNQNIIGVHGIIPLNHFDNNIPDGQIFITLWRVLENKGIGIGLLIFQKILKTYKPNFVAGLPMNSKVSKFYNRFGFECQTMLHHVALSQRKTQFNIAQVPENLKLKKHETSDKKIFAKLTADSLRKLDTKFLYEHQTPLKSDSYLINRYLDHPVYKYVIYSLSINILTRLLVVIRPIHINDTTVLTIVDYVGSNDDFFLLPDLMYYLLEKYDAEYIDIYSFGIPDENILKSGLLNVKKTESLIIPGLFEPFKKKNMNIICGFYNRGNAAPVRIFKGDSEADRPTKIENLN